MKSKLLLIVFLVPILVSVYSYFQINDQLVIAMLDIGQGDAIYIRTPQGIDILVDGGPDRRLLSELGSVMPPYDHTLEIVIATHPDADHIAGLAELPEVYNINNLIVSGATKSTGFSRELESWEKEQSVNVMQAYRGWRLDLEADLWLEFFNPDLSVFHEDANDDSVVFVLHYKEFSAMLTGDASVEIESQIIEALGTEGTSHLDVDMLKVGHHGSRTSTAENFLNVTTPQTALVSVGSQNKFGHPHESVINKLQQHGIVIYRSDLQGRVICKIDGYQHQCEPEKMNVK